MRNPTRRGRSGPAVALLAGGLVLAGCSTTTPAAPAAATTPSSAVARSATGAPPDATADWPTYHHDNARTGVAPGLAPLSAALRVAWQARLDGAVFGQPLVVHGMVLAGTENDTVYALDPSSGAVRWSTRLGKAQPQSGLPCGDIDPLGITGTMAYDQATNRVFALAETVGGVHTLFGLNVDTGHVDVHTVLEPPKGDKIAHQQRAALTVLDGRVFVAYGGLAGDCAAYIGSVVSATTAGTDPLAYAIPTTRQAGIWGPGGGVVTGDTLYYAAGNGDSRGGGWDGSDSVIALSPATLQRTDAFAPSTWPQDNADDLDLGSGSPAVVGNRLFVAGKQGVGFVLDPGHLGGVGGQIGKTQVCTSFGGSAVSGDTVYVPCPDGTRAVAIGADGTPAVRWHASVHAAGAPVLGGGAVWVVDYGGGTLYALDPASGATRTSVKIPDVPTFTSPTLAGTHAYIGAKDGVVAVAGA